VVLFFITLLAQGYYFHHPARSRVSFFITLISEVSFNPTLHDSLRFTFLRFVFYAHKDLTLSTSLRVKVFGEAECVILLITLLGIRIILSTAHRSEICESICESTVYALIPLDNNIACDTFTVDSHWTRLSSVESYWLRYYKTRLDLHDLIPRRLTFRRSTF